MHAMQCGACNFRAFWKRWVRFFYVSMIFMFEFANDTLLNDFCYVSNKHYRHTFLLRFQMRFQCVDEVGSHRCF